jgi:GT2 family glycosyltransferase
VVEVKPVGRYTARQVSDHVSARMARFKRPHVVVFTNALPRGADGVSTGTPSRQPGDPVFADAASPAWSFPPTSSQPTARVTPGIADGTPPAQSSVIRQMRPHTSDPIPGTRAAFFGDIRAVPDLRPSAIGKFLSLNAKTLWVRGVTYGTYRPGADGVDYPDVAAVERDFAAIAAAGFNAVRIYTVPPRWLLDAASTHGLRIMVGVPWAEHIAFLDERWRAAAIVARVSAGVRACAGHPAVLCYALGNEIPAPVVRWHGHRRVERFLARLADAARAADPTALVTYVNYPTTEYLDVPWADLVTFNLCLESAERLDAYLARLHNLAGDRPLVLGEIGIDSRLHGEPAQARMAAEQVRVAFAAGCAGAFVFAWTDDCQRGGDAVEDRDFGLTDRARHPKPALATVRHAFEQAPFPRTWSWPRISVVVCSYNGARTIAECLEGLARLEYPNYEVIVVDDGSTDETASIARRFDVRLHRTSNRGLSAARNSGLALATGEIVAYIDDDAYPDPHWLTYLATTFLTTNDVGVGGPNVPPPSDGPVAHAVAASPGGPVHVLVSDREAEHLPGCNMAFRRSALEAIGGFDPRFRIAGDDVDVGWRLRDAGGTLGFSPAALVWHHRRGSLRAYLRQQMGYGRAEALLERKWPERYNAAGHAHWAGRLYGGAFRGPGWKTARVCYGTWGSAPIQSVEASGPGLFAAVMTMPEWYLVVAAVAVVGLLGLLWRPLLLALPLLAAALSIPVATAVRAATACCPPTTLRSPIARLRYRALVAALHALQPVARLRGRLNAGLTPWRHRSGQLVPRARRMLAVWEQHWQSPDERLRRLERYLSKAGVPVRRGGDFDRWDLGVRGGLLGGARLVMLVEDHGMGRQLTRLSVRARVSMVAGLVTVGLAALTLAAAAGGALLVAAVLGAAAATLAVRVIVECSAAIGAAETAWCLLVRRTPTSVTVAPRERD